jgi:SAM-dependent methyltransferase
MATRTLDETTPTLDETTPTLDEAALEAFLGRIVGDAGAAISVLLSHLGDRLGLYTAMADSRPVTAAELAERTDTNPRMVEEWAANQAASGYLDYDPSTGGFRLPRERALALAVETSPALVQGLFDLIAAAYQSIDKELAAFTTGTGLTWADQHPTLFTATDRCFRPGYQSRLVQQWIPALPGMHDKLSVGSRVADVGCGYGTSTLILAQAYPNSIFVGYDYHPQSIEAARKAAEQAGLDDRVRFEVASGTDITGPFDLITFFNCWHDTADPLGIARAARAALADDGAVLAVEPFAHDDLEDNLGPLGRFGYGISTVVCVPCSISDGGPGLGGLAGEARTRDLFTQAGFTTFRRAAETPLNIVYEARP